MEEWVIRQAEEKDMKAVFDLSNETGVRNSSFRPDLIGWAEHQAWYRKKIADPDCLFLLAWDRDTLAGQIRMDREGHCARVSISLNPNSRRQGLGRLLLESAIRTLPGRLKGVEAVTAQIRKTNASSIRFFEINGFRLFRECEVLGQEAVEYRYRLV